VRGAPPRQSHPGRRRLPAYRLIGIVAITAMLKQEFQYSIHLPVSVIQIGLKSKLWYFISLALRASCGKAFEKSNFHASEEMLFFVARAKQPRQEAACFPLIANVLRKLPLQHFFFDGRLDLQDCQKQNPVKNSDRIVRGKCEWRHH